MPIRPSRPWLGATPLFGMPHTASAWVGMYTSIPAPTQGRSQSSDPVREGQIRTCPDSRGPDASDPTVGSALVYRPC